MEVLSLLAHPYLRKGRVGASIVLAERLPFDHSGLRSARILTVT